MKRLFVLAAATLAGCASTHDLSQGPNVWGGGVFKEELQPGLHYIVVRSNVAPWENRDMVAKQWGEQAGRLCSSGYQALRVEDLVEEELQPMYALGVRMRYLITLRKGYALCEGARLSAEAAERYLDTLR